MKTRPFNEPSCQSLQIFRDMLFREMSVSRSDGVPIRASVILYRGVSGGSLTLPILCREVHLFSTREKLGRPWEKNAHSEMYLISSLAEQDYSGSNDRTGWQDSGPNYASFIYLLIPIIYFLFLYLLKHSKHLLPLSKYKFIHWWIEIIILENGLK